MRRAISIIMYHYVRDLKRSRFPEIKGLDAADFKGQIDYIRRHYHVIGAEEMMAIAVSGEAFPPRAALLTFDDGYIDHFTQVFPVLDAHRLPGCFFPSAACVLENRVMDVNKIHFILAAAPDKARLADRIDRAVMAHRKSHHDLREPAYYRDKLARASRFDPPEVIYIKRMLQRELPEALRSALVDALFAEYVSADETAFAAELYMSLDQVACLRRHGMYVGCHGYHHVWLGHLPPERQAAEIDMATAFLERIGCDTGRWIMCYPHGSVDDALVSLLGSRGCVIGLTTRIAVADLELEDPLRLPRIDTNDLPRSGSADGPGGKVCAA